MKNILVGLACLMMSFSASVAAHGPGCSCGHHHGARTAPHGGQMVETANHLYVELVSNEEDVLVYVMDHDLKQVQSVSLSGHVDLPRRYGKGHALEFSSASRGHRADISIPGRAHRYTVDLEVTHNGRTEQVRFTVEK